jgi:SAM-dependent methyltransferase
MPEPIFADPRLVAIYDVFDGPRLDLDHYLSILNELNAKSVLDIGCGTGCFACLLISKGFEVTGVDPAGGSLDFARSKPSADRINWILGDVTNLPEMAVDAAVMTGNVAQVFLTDASWEEALLGARQALNPDGHLIFEVRNPVQKVWLDWTREKTYTQREVSGIGKVEGWCEVIETSKDLVTFQWTYIFESSGHAIKSESTLRFREREEIEVSLAKSGYRVREVRDAPDRPGKEFVFIASLTA